MSRFRILAVALVLGAPLVTVASDAPHEADALCSNCHMGHNALGGSLTSKSGNANLCNSCHLQHPGVFGFPWYDADQAVPGTTGRSHSWAKPADGSGATPPSLGSLDAGEVEMAKRLDGTNLSCSTCHDQHQADLLVTGRGTQHTSTPTPSFVDGAPRGVVTVNTTAPGAMAKGYRIMITATGTATTAKFRLSHDKGTSWWGCNPATYTYVANLASGCSAAATAVPLGNTAEVTVDFGAGNYVQGDYWDLYVAYPFLRADNTDAKMCLKCHRDRDQSTANVGGNPPLRGGGAIVLGTTEFSHPVGETLATTPSEPDGVLQTAGGGAGDGIKMNNLVLSASNQVTCLTCHRPHNAYSNSLTPDPTP